MAGSRCANCTTYLDTRMARRPRRKGREQTRMTGDAAAGKEPRMGEDFSANRRAVVDSLTGCVEHLASLVKEGKAELDEMTLLAELASTLLGSI